MGRRTRNIRPYGYTKDIVFFLIFLLIQSCAHKEIVGGLVNEIPMYQVEFDFSRPDTVKRQLKTLGDLSKRENQQKLVQSLIAFQRLTKKPAQSVLTFSPFSKTQIEVTTFCASSRNAIPEKNEIFYWAKGLPKIQMLKEVLDLYKKKSELNRQSFQEIVWNLESETLYENYPDNLKTILLEAYPSAPLILPSTLKSEVTEFLIPEEMKNAATLIQGHFHTYREIRNFVEQRKSNLPLPRDHLFSSLPNTHILTSTTSNGYESQLVSFYNSTPTLQNIVVSDFYLKPLREDVQPLVLASVFPYAEEIQKILEQAV